MILRLDGNTNVSMNQEGRPRGSQNFGLVARILRAYNFVKIILLAPKVIHETVVEH